MSETQTATDTDTDAGVVLEARGVRKTYRMGERRICRAGRRGR